MRRTDKATASPLGTIARHVLLMIVVLVLLTALAMWLGLGPVVHSRS
jgi:hypothetical protein